MTEKEAKKQIRTLLKRIKSRKYTLTKDDKAFLKKLVHATQKDALNGGGVRYHDDYGFAVMWGSFAAYANILSHINNIKEP